MQMLLVAFLALLMVSAAVLILLNKRTLAVGAVCGLGGTVLSLLVFPCGVMAMADGGSVFITVMPIWGHGWAFSVPPGLTPDQAAERLTLATALAGCLAGGCIGLSLAWFATRCAPHRPCVTERRPVDREEQSRPGRPETRIALRRQR